MRRYFTNFGLLLSALIAVLPIATQALAQAAIPTERVTFAPGRTSAVITRTIRGRETIDFLVNAHEAQQLDASMTSSRPFAYFNIIAPGETDVAFYAGELSSPTNRFVGPVPKSGDLKFRVYLNRAFARRGDSAKIRLTISITGKGGSATHLSGDALVPGTQYHATGIVDCWQRANGPSEDCSFGVRRLGDGSGSVTVTKSDGRTRTIIFERGTPVSYDMSQAENARMTSSRKDDSTIVRIGEESYHIPDAVLYGG